MSDRVACSACGKWMFHLAKTCPHCGAVQGAPVEEAKPAAPASPPKKLELTPEEARALLSVAPGTSREPGFSEVVADLVMPKSGGVDLALSVVAFPATGLTVAVLGWGLIKAKRAKREANLQGARLLAVPTAATFVSVVLWEFGAPLAVWGALGVSVLAFFVRDVLRARAKPDLFS